MLQILDAAEVRVLGSLIEKEATTPEYYPLSLNALVNACNQKSNREPVVDYDDETVLAAIESLREKRLALIVTGSGRVTKYGQRLSETLNLGRRELAVLCTLLLRAQQTLGEIKDRSERMFSFADLAETERLLQKLEELPDGGLVRKLPRQPGQKEARYAHLFSGEPTPMMAGEKSLANEAPSRVSILEQELQMLRGEFDELKRRFDELESQLR
jgi:hypothetical protein